MTTKVLLTPELHGVEDLFPIRDFANEDLPQLRKQLAASLEWNDASAVGVERKSVSISGNGFDVPCVLYRPPNPCGGAYLHIHGGGFLFGSPKGADPSNLTLCEKLNVVVLSVDYRLAPEHPYPAALDDCYAALTWLHDNASALNTEPSRIAIGGESAGGGLAAALALRARDAGGYSVCHQHLIYPMLDDKTGSGENPGDPLTGEFVWTRASNQFGWNAYLGPTDRVAPAVPARTEDLTGLPSTWMFTVGLDLFRDENIHYANRLMAAGVPTELIVWPGACHGFQRVPNTKIGARFAQEHLSALGRGLSC